MSKPKLPGPPARIVAAMDEFVKAESLFRFPCPDYLGPGREHDVGCDDYGSGVRVYCKRKRCAFQVLVPQRRQLFYVLDVVIGLALFTVIGSLVGYSIYHFSHR